MAFMGTFSAVREEPGCRLSRKAASEAQCNSPHLTAVFVLWLTDKFRIGTYNVNKTNLRNTWRSKNGNGTTVEQSKTDIGHPVATTTANLKRPENTSQKILHLPHQLVLRTNRTTRSRIIPMSRPSFFSSHAMQDSLSPKPL